MDIKPDFESIRKTIGHHEPDRIPVCEDLVE